MSHENVLSAAMLALISASATPALAKVHAVILDPQRATDQAFLDVTSEPGMMVTYIVNPSGLAPQTVASTLPSENFTTSEQDLNAAAGGRLALLVGTTSNPSAASMAVLRQGKRSVPVPGLD